MYAWIFRLVFYATVRRLLLFGDVGVIALLTLAFFLFCLLFCCYSFFSVFVWVFFFSFVAAAVGVVVAVVLLWFVFFFILFSVTEHELSNWVSQFVCSAFKYFGLELFGLMYFYVSSSFFFFCFCFCFYVFEIEIYGQNT